MRVFLICIEDVNATPPARSILTALAELCDCIHVISTERIRGEIAENVIQHPMTSRLRNSRFGKYLGFRKHVVSCIERLAAPDDPLWIATLNSGLCLIESSCLVSRPFIFQSLELYDEHPMRKRALIYLARRASAVVVPESTRAAIIQVWAALDQRPLVLPNKPYYGRFTQTDPAKKERREMGDAQTVVMLYQGGWGRERTMSGIVDFVLETQADVELWFMGSGNNEMAAVPPTQSRIKHIGYREPPAHLEITKTADIGILKYDPTSLNNMFCAPNKIWEYSCFSLPMIANDCPPIRHTFEAYGCGEIVDFSRDSIEMAVDRIRRDYSNYSSGSHRFYQSVDYLDSVRGILAGAGISLGDR